MLGPDVSKKLDPYHIGLAAECKARGLPPRAFFSNGSNEVGPLFNALMQGVPAEQILSTMQDDLMGTHIEYDWSISDFQKLFAGSTSAPRPCRSWHAAVYNVQAPWQRIWMLRYMGKHPKLSDFRAALSEMPRQAIDLWVVRFEGPGHIWPRSLRDIMTASDRVKLQFDAAEVSTVEALSITGHMNNALSATLLRDLDDTTFNVEHWESWYQPDGTLRSRKRCRS